jgi:hypothetical protein
MGFDVAAVDGKLDGNGASGRHVLEHALPPDAETSDCIGCRSLSAAHKTGGTSRHRQPVFKTCRMPEMTVRSSTRGLPGLPRGGCGPSAFQASSDSQNKLFAMTIALQRLKSGANIQSNQ